jgi:GT2 family glycosyltransferase
MSVGALLALIEGTLIGWASCGDASENSVCLVEILVNDTVVDIARADQNLGETFTQLTPCQRRFGFSVYLPSLNQADCIEARLANTRQKLQGTMHPSNEKSSTTFLLGQVENHGGLKIWGWLWNPALPEMTQKVIISYQGEELACIEANLYREELAEQGINSGHHGFEWTLPLCFADGRVHEIEVFDSLGCVLAGSSLSVFVPQHGYQHWVNQLAIQPNEALLLDKLAERYQRYVGHSLDFSMYGKWRDEFGSPHVSIANDSTLILVVIYGDGSIEATLNSLYLQTHQSWQVLICGRWSQLLYHTDERIHSISPENWETELATLFERDGLVTTLAAGDSLAPQALAMAVAVMCQVSVNLVYSDCDVPDAKLGVMPWFKPDWDIDLFLNTAALQDLCVFRGRYLVQMPKVDYLNCPLWVAHVITALGEKPEGIVHLPWVLYHRAKPYELENTLASSSVWLTAHAKKAHIQATQFNTPRISWPLPKKQPRVSIIIPTRDHLSLLERCITTLKQTDYPNIEWIVIDNDSRETKTLNYLTELAREGVKIVPYTGSFNFSAMNNRAVALATGDMVALVNNDVEMLDSQWLSVMVSELLRPNVGVVGAKLLWGNDMVQHAGVLLGLHSLAGHVGNEWHRDDLGYFGLNQHTRGVSAVTAACLVCRREDYLALGGFNDFELMVNFNDVDFCLRLQKILGKRVVWTPHAQLRHLESASRGKEQLPAQQARIAREKRYMRTTWAAKIANDPYYNPNLNLDRYSHIGLSFPPRHISK